MSHIEQMIRLHASEGLQITLWHCKAGFQANVKEGGHDGWTVATDKDPVTAVRDALYRRLSRQQRDIISAAQPDQGLVDPWDGSGDPEDVLG